MPVPDFHGDTFVAFMDIAGFKSMMTDGERARLALDTFYTAGFNILQNHRNEVHGFFISDCGILFVRREQEPPEARLESLCRVVEQVHRQTFQKAIQLTTSIAWGEFTYHDRIEFPGILKGAIYGNAYVSAYLDNEKDGPKLWPSECRLKQACLPQNVIDFCRSRRGSVASRMRETQHHFYYEWMREMD